MQYNNSKFYVWCSLWRFSQIDFVAVSTQNGGRYALVNLSFRGRTWRVHTGCILRASLIAWYRTSTHPTPWRARPTRLTSGERLPRRVAGTREGGNAVPTWLLVFYPVQLQRVKPYVVVAVLHVQDLRLLQIRAYLTKARFVGTSPHDFPTYSHADLPILISPKYDAGEAATRRNYFELHFETVQLLVCAQTASGFCAHCATDRTANDPTTM